MSFWVPILASAFFTGQFVWKARGPVISHLVSPPWGLLRPVTAVLPALLTILTQEPPLELVLALGYFWVIWHRVLDRHFYQPLRVTHGFPTGCLTGEKNIWCTKVEILSDQVQIYSIY